MTTQFHKGQEVEVLPSNEEYSLGKRNRTARVVRIIECEECGTLYKVRYEDGVYDEFDPGYILAAVLP